METWLATGTRSQSHLAVQAALNAMRRSSDTTDIERDSQTSCNIATMYTAQTLLDVHARAHESLRRLIVFCGALTDDEFRRPVAGFGWSTVQRQLEHTIGAEVYWQTVVTRGYTEEATLPELPDVAALEAFRQQTAFVTRSYLERASEAELNSRRQMISDPGQTRVLRPADVIMRVVTHIFNHQGQVLAMCRTIGKPNDTEDLDYPVD